jgi:hypothetical protein
MIRYLAILLLSVTAHAASFTDNGTNIIKLQSGAVTVGGTGISFAVPNQARGMLVISNSSQTQVFGTSPSQITNFTLAWSGNRGIGGSFTNGTMVLTNAGTYLINYGMSFTSSSAMTLTGELYLDEVGTGIRFQKQTPATTDTEVLRIMGLATVTAGQTLTMRLNVAASTETLTLRCGSLNAVQLAD